ASAVPDANDPRSFRQRFAAYNLWGNGWLELSGWGLMQGFNGTDPEKLVRAVRKTLQHEHSVPRMFLTQWLKGLSFDELAPYWFDIYRAVGSQAPTAVMWNHHPRDDCMNLLKIHNFKETVDAAATYAETMKNHGAEYRMGEVMDVLVSFGTEAQRVLPRLYAARTFYQNNWGPGKTYDFPQWATDEMLNDLNAGITAIENATTAPTGLRTIYDYSIVVLRPPSAAPSIVDAGSPTTLSVKALQFEDLPISYTWSKISGPGDVNFGSLNAAETTATFTDPGLYELQVSMQDAYRTKTATLSMVVGGSLTCELGRLNLQANGGINPATGQAWRLGDSYRLVFVSSGTTTAQSTNLATYDTFVQNLATTAGLGAGNWKMIGSTSTVDARDHTATNPSTNGSAEAVILIDGSTVIANNYADLWDGSIDAAINRTEQGVGGVSTEVFTGTYNNGTKEGDGRYLGGSSESPPKVTTGHSNKISTWWVRDYNFPATNSKRVYAISKVLRVAVTFPPLPAAYELWSQGSFANAFTRNSLGSNPDGDRRSNLMEFAFGTDPTKADMGELTTNGSRHGDPITKAASGGAFELYFIRRKDHGSSGSLTYTPCFSSDLVSFHDNNQTANPVVVAASSTVSTDYEVVKVPYPASLPNGQRARFAYVRLAVVP
ncbi:MAG TPA: hypothetical protein VFY13_06805, partial [Luteolibacter sp.]|nr:hypothetical protein [Luteolibacter sp.]